MTDLLSKPAASEEDELAASGDPAAPVEVVWLPAKKPRGRALALWLGIPSGLVVVTAAVCATILIAPGVLVGGVDIGLRTPGFASDVVASTLADTRVTFDTPSGDITLTGAELGLSVDPKAVAQLVHGDHPLWNVGAWNPGNISLDVAVDPATANAALSAAAPDVFPAAVDAAVVFDETSKTFVVENPESGLGVGVDDLAAAVSDSLSAGSTAVTFVAKPVSVSAPITSAIAVDEAASLNELLSTAGFYVDGNKVVGIDPAMAASWLTVTAEGDTLSANVDSYLAVADMKTVVATLPKTVNRPAQDEIIVTNSAGEHLRKVQDGADGWALAPITGLAATFVDSFAAGDGTIDLTVTETTFKTTLAFRTLEVDKSEGITILYENGVEVDRYNIAVGRPETATDEGRFTVYAQLPMQDMGCSPGFDYCTKNVPWITYFNGDEGFHGTYWHNNFGAGAMMSHGCVNMTIEAAERVYRFAQEGTEVWVHS